MTWNLFAHLYGRRSGPDCFMHIGSQRYVEIHGLSEPIVEIALTEDPEGGYYGWLGTGNDTPSMIWPSWAQFSMCFAYGPQVEVDRGNGTIVRMKAELIRRLDGL